MIPEALPAAHLLDLARTHRISGLIIAFLLACILLLRRRLRLQSAGRHRECRQREEMEAYAVLDTASAFGPAAAVENLEGPRILARRVCRTVAHKSVFPAAAMLLRDPEGKLVCASTAGMDELSVQALQLWAQQITAEERSGDPVRSLTTGTGISFGSVRVGLRSFAIQLGNADHFDPDRSQWAQEGHRERRRFHRAIATPMRLSTGRISGVLIVLGVMAPLDRPLGLERAMVPIEILALKIGTAIESAAIAERLLRAEKLGALGQLAGGVAHALNNPLTAILGFGEHISETAAEDSVRRDAGTIVTEAVKMRDTIQRLIEFWRPVRIGHDPIAVVPMIRELAELCAPTLEERGVRLIVTTSDLTPVVRGNQERLRQVLEHLLNNAAQAISTVPPPSGEPHAIRLTLSHDERGVHIIVSDTGPGFVDPHRFFDPFYTTRQVGEGTGLGLSICYGIVREHGGEINAFNLHPYGAAVVIELPVRQILQGEEETNTSDFLIPEVA
jgi:signal transduction histidine kinase